MDKAEQIYDLLIDMKAEAVRLQRDNAAMLEALQAMVREIDSCLTPEGMDSLSGLFRDEVDNMRAAIRQATS